MTAGWSRPCSHGARQTPVVSTLRAVLFDLDDTLIDWSDWGGNYYARNREHIEAVLASLPANGRQPPFLDLNQQQLETLLHELPHDGWQEPDLDAVEQDYIRRTEQAWAVGRSNLRAPHLGDILVETLSAAGVPDSLLQREALLRAVPWGMYPGVVCFPDALPALQLLREHGIHLGLVTNAHQPMMLRDRELEACGLLDFMPDCRLSAADVGWLKPHPRIFRTALELLDVEPQEAVFVGDNPVADIAGAQNARMRAVLRSGRQDTAMLAGLIEPDSRIQSLDELPILLDDWFPGWR